MEGTTEFLPVLMSFLDDGKGSLDFSNLQFLGTVKYIFLKYFFFTIYNQKKLNMTQWA